MTNYSLRIEDDLREEMREVPDMADRIRDFIQREVSNYKHDARTEVEEFCHGVLDEHGITGAYCLEQLTRSRQHKYIENVETRFANTDVEIQDARLAAKQIRDEWENLPRTTGDEVEEILDQRGFYDQFYTHALNKVRGAVESSASSRWGYWTALQLARAYEEDFSRRDAYSIETEGISRTLECHDFDEEAIQEALENLVEIGGLRGYHDSRAYFYEYMRIPGYIVEALSDGIEKMDRKVKTRVENYCEEDPYLEQVSRITRGEDHLFKKQIGEETDESDLERLIQQGAVVLKHRSRRTNTGRRSALPSRTEAILAPAVRQVVGNAYYRRGSE